MGLTLKKYITLGMYDSWFAIFKKIFHPVAVEKAKLQTQHLHLIQIYIHVKHFHLIHCMYSGQKRKLTAREMPIKFFHITCITVRQFFLPKIVLCQKEFVPLIKLFLGDDCIYLIFLNKIYFAWCDYWLCHFYLISDQGYWPIKKRYELR